jgi:dihydropteroate synthase
VRITALAGGIPAALAQALAARGVDPVHAEAAGAGGTAVRLAWDQLAEDDTFALFQAARAAGVECTTGEGWAVLEGTLARLGGLARPGSSGPLPPRLSEPLGRFLSARTAVLAGWRTAQRTMLLDRPCVMGILNVTPDSFSDGGRLATVDDALRAAEALRDAGADVLDVGGESTRPGAGAGDEAEERRRVVPVIRRLVAEVGLPVSVDTRRASVAAEALAAGAEIVNDVSALTHDPAMAGVASAAGAGVVLMHMRGTPETMDAATTYGDVAPEVAAELAVRRDAALAAGIAREAIVLDPGLGFAKTVEQSFALVNRLESLVALGQPVLVGPSRKRFLGAATGRAVHERDAATAAVCVAARLRGAWAFRVHDVRAVREALAVADAVLAG